MPVRCAGITKEGKPCSRPTTSGSGYCEIHKKQLESLEVMNILHCDECPFLSCPQRNKAVKGLCYYELYDISGELDTQDKMKHILKETIRAQRLLHRRLMRYISLNFVGIVDHSGNYNDEIIRRVQSLEDSIVKNLKMYAEITGLKVIKSEKTQEKKYKTLMKMFDYEEQIKDLDPNEVETMADVIEQSGIVLIGEEKEILSKAQKRKALESEYCEIDLENIDTEEGDDDDETEDNIDDISE